MASWIRRISLVVSCVSQAAGRGRAAAHRARRERAVTVWARLAVLATAEDRRTDELHHLTRDGARP
ncbi:hypothetical protein O3Q52_53885, partial [Streptomyces sp. ActVer]|uniref:hypothetical protein n=1 Tax=Streptomyces sp. ActVer TaxID=3014558 RepID=UPI0022B55538